jgi:glyceraldehyde-3-phosphate dehydrogenase (NADP+)
VNDGFEMLIDGAWRGAEESFEVLDPQDASVVATVPLGRGADMRDAIDAAAHALGTAWPTHARMAALRGAADAIERDAESFARTIAREGIKTIREARLEVSRCVDTVRISAEEARRLHGETVNFDQRPGSEARFGYWVREPVGVIGAITPFNDPLNLVAHKLGPALAGGNAVILKPDSKTPLSGIRLVAALHQAGVPAGRVQVVPGRGRRVGKTLVTDPRVRMVSFTGGLEAGEEIARQAGLKKIGMELGSNCPVIVMDDADLELAVPSCVSGAFWAAGQNCLHVQRLLVQNGVYSEVRDAFVRGAEALRVGNKLDEATDMGPLVNEDAAVRVEAAVRSAVAAGATVLTGGTRDGSFVAPTVLEDVPEIAPFSCEEIYGPVTALYPFETLDDAIRLANGTDYGLQAAVFTASLATARAAAERLDFGTVMINESTDFRIDAMPFGGRKRSGLGREGVRFALEEMTEPKLVCFS